MPFNRYVVINCKERPGIWRPKLGSPVPGHNFDPKNKLPGGFRRFDRWYKLPLSAHRLYWRMQKLRNSTLNQP